MQYSLIHESNSFQYLLMIEKLVIGNEYTEEIVVNRLFPNPSHEMITYQGKEVASMGIMI